jgi:hypothetical protein
MKTRLSPEAVRQAAWWSLMAVCAKQLRVDLATMPAFAAWVESRAGRRVCHAFMRDVAWRAGKPSNTATPYARVSLAANESAKAFWKAADVEVAKICFGGGE